MKTSKEIEMKCIELLQKCYFTNLTEFHKQKWYSEEELNKARLNGIRDLRDMIQSDLNKLFKKYTQDFNDIQSEYLADNFRAG